MNQRCKGHAGPRCGCRVSYWLLRLPSAMALACETEVKERSIWCWRGSNPHVLAERARSCHWTTAHAPARACHHVTVGGNHMLYIVLDHEGHYVVINQV